MMLCCLAAAGQTGLTISELLYQPRSGEAEYVELYNSGDAAVELSDFHIVRWVGDSLGKHYKLPVHTVGPHDYVVLTKDAASVAANYNVKYMAKVVECQLPPYPNDGGSVILSTADSVLVDSEEGYGYQQFFTDGKKGKLYTSIPSDSKRTILQVRQLGLKRL